MHLPDLVWPLTAFAAGAALALIVLYRHGRQRFDAGLRSGDAERARLEERLAQQQKQADEKVALLQETERRLADAFKALSAEALKSNNQSFLDLAKTTLEKYQQGARDDLGARQKAIEQLTLPIRERLEKFDGKLEELEKARHGAYTALNQQLRSLVEVDLPRLHAETANLVKALRQPAARGRWGEIQLRRVVEMAGMLDHCDFMEQESRETEDGGRVRPDLTVYLPGGRRIVVDAKTPLEPYLNALEATDDESRASLLKAFAQRVREHMTSLGRKNYWDQFEVQPEIVVMFLPGEMFFSAALQADPSLIEIGVEQRVIAATPTTLIALLRAVAFGWRQEALAENAQQVANLGRQLYERIATLTEHWRSVGDRLGKTMEAYNRSVGTLETRVLPGARKFQDLKVTAGGVDIPPLTPVEHAARPLTAPELAASSPGENDKSAD